MNQKVKLITGNLLVVLLLLLLIETVCYLLLPEQYRHIGFMLNIKGVTSPAVHSPENGFDQVDPLLGWQRTEARCNALGFKLDSNIITLSTTEDTTGRINILITGGSTSDVAIDTNNWPVHFFALLKQHGIKAKLYCAGTGGFNSAQELLKLIRDGVCTGPWLHISYSGANEFFDQSYVSAYEQNFYQAAFDRGGASMLMPNTVMYIRNKIYHNEPGAVLRNNDLKPEAPFWETNMRLMHGTALEYNYRFIGFLQPVLGSGQYQQTVTGHDESIAQYRRLYPQFKQAAARHPAYIADLSAMFDTCRGNVFKDNCHIEPAYQPQVAQHIFDTLVARGVFDK